jgi:hypothetical protein
VALATLFSDKLRVISRLSYFICADTPLRQGSVFHILTFAPQLAIEAAET